MRAGGIEQVVAVMTAHMAVEEVQGLACWVLKTLAYNNDTHKVHNAWAACIERVGAALLQHPASVMVQSQGLLCLLRYSSFQNNDISKAQMVAAGCIEQVVAAMTVHLDVAKEQEVCLGILINLTTARATAPGVAAATQTQLARAGGVMRVMSTMAAHPSVAIVQLRAITILCNFAFNSDDAYWTKMAGEAVKRILLAMKNHPADAQVQAEAIRWLSIAFCKTPHSWMDTKIAHDLVLRIKQAIAAAGATENTKTWGQSLLA